MAHQDLISRMTLEEKCALLQGATAFGSFALPRLGIPALQFSDGPHGLRHQDPAEGNHLGIGGSLPATCFPTSATAAQSWDPSLGELLGAALGEEAACQGVGCVLGPGLNIKRSPLGGRSFEYFSEDPVLAGAMAAAYVRGIQSQGIAACPKHFAANSQETRRQTSSSIVDERTLRELYLAGFERVVREADPWCLMTSYNLINGCYANESSYLLKQILRDEWGFAGAVVSDWGGSNDHVAGVAAGSTFEMPAPGYHEARTLISAVRSGELSEEVIDQRVEEALQLVMRTRPAVEASRERDFDADAHHRLARSIAAQSIVLLKNDAAHPRGALDGTSPLLPLAPGTRVALLGDFALTPRYQGAGSSLVRCTQLDSLAALIGQEDLEVVGIAQGYARGADTDPSLQDAAVRLAKQADVAILALGLDEASESEGMDRRHLRIPAAQVTLLHAVSAVNPNTVVLLCAGAPVETDWAHDACALVHLALGGQAGAGAAFDVLMGRQNPCGKTSETWFARLSDTPTAGAFPSESHAAEYREGLFVGYRYCQTAGVSPAFPFGFGLSYTDFYYQDLRIEPGDPITGAGTRVHARITNTGNIAGAEIVQLYVAKPEREVFRPEQTLAAFAKVHLLPGESRDVDIELDERAFSYWNVQTHAWEVEAGSYELRVAASSDDVRLTGTIELAGTSAPNPYAGVDIEPYETGRVATGQVGDAQFAALLGRPIPAIQQTIDENTPIRELTRSRSPLLIALGAALGRAVREQESSPTSALHLAFVYDMPLRSIGQMTGGLTDRGLVRALVREAKGWGLSGAIFPVASWILKRRLTPGTLLWLAWVAAPPLASVASNLMRDRAFARKLRRRGDTPLSH